MNNLEGLELHKSVFSAVELEKIVNHVYSFQEKGKMGELKERPYTAPQKWKKGKGCVNLQFGCCYNYAKVINFLLSHAKVNVDAVNACRHTAADISTSMCSSESDNNLDMNGDHGDDQSDHYKK
ncbi:hypothetical protein LWI29_038154 [Acer saccharum]|uniref:Uncharacterized protein n=1 Tax=Acer saccharum TaxID=4024 RepID=A0AA39S5M2_ACESA|nr:hypothetical protein LWI29_038154 [Acer saccharum]